MNEHDRFPFAPGVIQGTPKRRSWLRLKFHSSVVEFLGACALVALAFFVAGWLL